MVLFPTARVERAIKAPSDDCYWGKMAAELPQKTSDEDAWSVIAAMVDSEGSAAHSIPLKLAGRQVAVRDLADAIHALCALHGGHPGVVDHALDHNAQGAAHDWLATAAEGFAVERSYLAHLTAAAGPLPSSC